MREKEKYLEQTRSQSKSSSITLPEVHGVDKGINLHVKPKNKQTNKQTIKPMTVMPEVKTPTWRKPRKGQGRAGLRRKVKIITPPQPNKPAQVMPKPDIQIPKITA